MFNTYRQDEAENNELVKLAQGETAEKLQEVTERVCQILQDAGLTEPHVISVMCGIAASVTCSSHDDERRYLFTKFLVESCCKEKMGLD